MVKARCQEAQTPARVILARWKATLLYSVSEPIAHRKETRLPVAGERIVRIKADMNAFDKAISSSFQKIDDGEVGHKNSCTTQTFYEHWIPRDMSHIADKMTAVRQAPKVAKQ